MVAIRPKQVFNGVRNQGLVVPQQVTIFSRSNGCLIRVFRNGTITPATWVDVDTQNSICEYSLSATAITGGQVVYAGMCGQDAAQTFLIGPDTLGRLLGAYSHILPANLGDTFTVCATSLNATATVTVGLGWKEIR